MLGTMLGTILEFMLGRKTINVRINIVRIYVRVLTYLLHYNALLYTCICIVIII